MSSSVKLDLNNLTFQKHLIALQKDELHALVQSLGKLRQLTWEQVYRDKGLRWEAVLHRAGPGGGRLYTVRVTRKFRALVYREGDFMRFLSLHSDHDSAYE